MKLLFVYYMDVKEFDGKYYASTLSEEILERYKNICSQLTWATSVSKVRESKKLNNLNEINKGLCDFIQIKKVRSLNGILLNRKSNKNILEKAIKEHDKVIIRIPSSSASDAVNLCKKYNKPYLLEVVGCAWDAFWFHSLKGKLIAPFMTFQMKRMVKNAPFTVYVSEKFLQNRYPCENNVLGCSDVFLPDVKIQDLNDRISKIKNMKDRKKISIGTVAPTNVRYKGQQYVIKAISLLKNKGYDITYFVVGGGDTEYLYSIANKYNVLENIKFCGAIPHKSVFKFMKEIDIYIQPSNAESHGRVIVEAFSVACPVIGSSTGGIPELVEKKYIFDKKKHKELAIVLENMINSDMQVVANNNYQKCFEFTSEILGEKRNAFYNLFSKYNS